MPVGIKELERWKRGQETKSRSEGAMAEMIRAAHASGSLNLSNRQLQEVPEALLNYEETGAQENWWEVAGLKKLDLSHNAISLLPDALFTPLTELQVLYVGSNKLSSIPRAMTGCAMTLTRLALPHNELGELPDWIGELNALTYIAVDHNRISRIPPSIGALSDMDTLILSHNELTCLPDELCNLKSLKTLNASSNRISALPQNIGNLRGIEQLELGHNKLTSLPPSLRGMCSLVRIDLRENQIREIPALPSSVRLAELLLGFNKLAGIPSPADACPNLAVLDLRDNALQEESSVASFLHLGSLKSLDLRNNELKGLPAELGLRTTLTSLLLEGNPIKSIRRAILTGSAREILEYLRSRLSDEGSAEASGRGKGGANFGGADAEVAYAVSVAKGNGKLDLRKRGLTALPEIASELGDAVLSAEVSENEVEALPSWISTWTSVQYLDAASNRLGSDPRSLSESLASLKSLTEVSLRRNFLTCVPPSIATLPLLVSVDLNQNKITSIPPHILAACPRVHTLVLCYNQISSLPDEICHMASLTHLDVSNNTLAALPVTLCRMKNMQSLAVSNNALTNIDPRIGLLPMLKSITIDGNPLKLIRRAIVEAGTERIMACLRDKVPAGGGEQLPPAPPVPNAINPQQMGDRYERDDGGFARGGGNYGREGAEEWGVQGAGQRMGGGMQAVGDDARHSHGRESNTQQSLRDQQERTFGQRHGEMQQAYDGGYAKQERTFGQQSMGQGGGRENSDPRAKGRGHSMKQGHGVQQATGLHPQVQQVQQQQAGGGGGGGGGKRAELEEIMKGCEEDMARLEDELSAPGLSQAMMFAVKKKLAMARAGRGRALRELQALQ